MFFVVKNEIGVVNMIILCGDVVMELLGVWLLVYLLSFVDSGIRIVVVIVGIVIV